MALRLSRDRYDEFGELRRDVPLPLLIASRFCGWVALGVWLGGLIATEFYFAPVLTATLKYIPLLLRHDDWQSRIVSYAHVGVLNQIDFFGFICLVFLIQAALLQTRLWTGEKIAGYLPPILVTALGATLIYLVDLRLDYATATPSNYFDTLNRLDDLILVQIGLLVALAFVFTWMQSVPTIVQQEAKHN